MSVQPREQELSADRLEDIDTGEVVERIKAGDTEAFSVIYERYFDRIYGYLRLMLNDPHEAESVAHEVFVNVFVALPRYERRHSFWSWLFTITRNQALSALRRQGRITVEDANDIAARHDEAAADRAPDPAILGWISDSELLLFVQRLPHAQRQVVALRYLLGLTNAETAATLDRMPREVSLLHYRALTFLRERLAAVGRRGASRRGVARAGRRFKEAPVLRSRRFMLTRY